MFFYSFNEPKQIRNLAVESLSQYIDFLRNGGYLFSLFSNEFSEHIEDVDIGEERNSYQFYTTESEYSLKAKFAKYLRGNHFCNTTTSGFNIYYRGISDSSFLPVPTIYRDNNIQYEDKFINDIRVVNPDFVKNKTYIDELSALQHYGCPTRLLDISCNPLVALYFACEEHKNSEGRMTDGTVLLFIAKDEDVLHSNSDKVLILTAVSHLSNRYKNQLYDICTDEIKKQGADHAILKANRTAVKKLYNEIFKVAPYFEKEIKCIDLLKTFYVQPALNNLRIRAQSGLFLINGLSSNTRECASRNENKIFAKLVIPAIRKKVILDELDKVGINRKSLFPEIEDTINYLKTIYR